MIESKAIDDGLKFRNQINAEAQCKVGSEVMKSEFDTLEQYQESMKEFNENTRMGFEEFIQSHGSDRNKLQLRCTPYTSKKGGYGSFDLDFGLCVYQHQQSKVDELLKHKSLQELEINQIAQANQQWQLKCSELQKRVDAAIYLLTSIKAENDLWGCDQVERQIELLEQALKGGGK